jgi:lipopolysaccharide transport system ATP-binding protein
MRLAFAVAAHIEPEILLIDEVLAVSDTEFQKKSVERLEQVGRGGQTVVLVSHDIQTVLRLCHRAVCLDQGRVVEIGPAAEVAARYLEIGGANHGERRYADGPFAPGDSVVRLRGVRVCHRDGETLPTADIGQEIGLEIEFEVMSASVLFPSISLHSESAAVLWVTDASGEWHGRERPPGRYRETAWLPPHLLSPGALRATVAIRSFGRRPSISWSPMRWCFRRSRPPAGHVDSILPTSARRSGRWFGGPLIARADRGILGGT